MDLQTFVKIAVALFVQLHHISAEYFYSFVKRNVPLAGIIKIIPGVTKRVCVLKCRMSKNCGYLAIDTESKDCIHLRTLNITGGEKVVAVNLLKETSNDLKVKGI